MLVVSLLVTACVVCGAFTGNGINHSLKISANSRAAAATQKRVYQRAIDQLELEREAALQAARIEAERRIMITTGLALAVVLPLIIVLCGLRLAWGLSGAVVQRAELWAITLPAHKQLIVGGKYKHLTAGENYQHLTDGS